MNQSSHGRIKQPQRTKNEAQQISTTENYKKDPSTTCGEVMTPIPFVNTWAPSLTHAHNQHGSHLNLRVVTMFTNLKNHNRKTKHLN